MKILLVEDDVHLADVLTITLKQHRYVVEWATDGQMGWELLQVATPQIMIVDVELPKMDGITLCRKVREQGLSIPILLLTARSTSDDKIIGLESGADDYLVKPCSLDELSARLRALLRRSQTLESTRDLKWGLLTLNPDTCEVTYSGKPITLRPKEYSLLELFLRNNRRVFSRSAIVDQLWSIDDVPNEETVKAHIKGLRQNLKNASAPPELIEAVYGLGYRLNPQFENPPTEIHPVAQGETQTGIVSTLESQRQAVQSLKAAWPRFKPKMMERIQVIRLALDQWQTQGSLEPDFGQKARQAAHQLAGSLGTLGFRQGTDLARQMEQQFQSSQTFPLSLYQEQLQALNQALEGDPILPEPLPAPLPTPPASPNTPIQVLAVGLQEGDIGVLQSGSPPEGIQLTVAQSVDWVSPTMPTLKPDVVLLNVSEMEGNPPLLSLWINWIRQHRIPFLGILHHDTLSERLKVTRIGGSSSLVTPLNASTVWQTVRNIYQRFSPREARLLIVDDDPEFLALVQGLIEPWGFEVATLTDPQEFWQVLHRDPPDMVLLDVEMPHVSGIELCQVIRNDSRFSQLPVLILTAHQNAETIIDVFTAGADDFVSKPVVGPELIARILNRLHRSFS